MGKATGFLDYKRNASLYRDVKERTKDWNELYKETDFNVIKLQGARCMDCGVPFCHAGMEIENTFVGCPLNNLIPEWNDLVYKGKIKEAYKRLSQTSNFPEFTSRVCPALCENSCTAGLNFDAVTVKNIERYIIDYAWENGLIKPRCPKIMKNKTVAVVGSGPAGLSCADSLNQMGYSVTVFEKSDRAGGLLMYGIPNMKLDKDIVSRRIKLMEEEGIEFRCNSEAGKDYTFDELDDNFDAVVVCCGAQKPRKVNVDGADLNGIYYAVDYLKSSTKNILGIGREKVISAKDKHVTVIGGGDTGCDCIATAIRQGAREVAQLEIMPALPKKRCEDNPWPQYARIEKTDYGNEEAISVFGSDIREYLTTVTGFAGDRYGNVNKVHTVKVEWIKNDKNIMTPVYKEGTQKVINTDMVLVATGFVGVSDEIISKSGLKTDKRGNILTDNFKTSKQGFFAAGDCRRGQSLVVHAIKEGRQVALAVKEYLK